MKNILKNNKKIKLLRITPTLDPKFGGPSTTIISSSLILKKKGINVDIITCDNKNSKYVKTNKIKIINFGKGYLGNYCLNFKMFQWLKKNKDNYDLFIVHGIWTFVSLMSRLLIKKKYYIYTHGQLDPFFSLNFLKKIKKKIYWFFIEKSNLLNSKLLLLTSNGENKFNRDTYVNTSGIKKKVVQYGIVKNTLDKNKLSKIFYKKFKHLKNNDFYLYLGRYHEKKGCEIIIESVNKLKDQFQDKVLLCGPINNTKYEKKIKYLIKIYNLEKIIFFHNAIYGDLKWAAINQSKAMILPSHGENFGVSLVESMSMSKPIISTNKVGISDDILKFKAGYISSNTISSFSGTLKKFMKLDKKSLKIMSLNAYKCFNTNFNLNSEKNSLFNLLYNDYSKNYKNL